MLGLTQGAEPSESKAIFDLLAIVSDPAAAKKRIDELLKTLASAKESVAKADAREKVLLKLDQETTGRANAVASAELSLAAKSDDVTQERERLDKVKNDLVLRESELSTKEAVFIAEVKKRKSSLDEQESALAGKVAAAAIRDKVETERFTRRAKELDDIEKKLNVKEAAMVAKQKKISEAFAA